MFIELSLDGQELILNGELTIPMNMQGLILLRNRLAVQKRVAHAARPEPQPIIPSDLSRVCHCGKPAGTVDKCEGCPGYQGAGKVRRFNTSGKEKLTLADLGL